MKTRDRMLNSAVLRLVFLVIAILIVWYVIRPLGYQWTQEAMIKKTIREMVREDALRERYE